MYGIALDIDPSINTCCGCVPPWTDHPMCAEEVTSIFERMQMPECWVRQFERFGWYWLGRDTLQDTMHFEFLGDPTQITPAAGTAPIRPRAARYPVADAGPRASCRGRSADASLT